MKYLIFSLILITFVHCGIFVKNTDISQITFPLIVEKEIKIEGKIIDELKEYSDRIYFATQEGFLYCFDPVEKRIIWKFNAEEETLTVPFIGKEYIYFVTKNSLFCINRNTGKLKWKEKLSATQNIYFSEVNGYFYMAFDKKIQFRRSENGEVLKEYKIKSQVNSQIIIWENGLIFLSRDGKIYFIERNGNIKHLIKKIPEVITSNLFRDEEYLYFGSNNYFYCYNLRKRKLKWKIRTGGSIIGFPVVDEKRIYFICSNNVIFCMNKRGGDILWWKSIPSRVPFQLSYGKNLLLVSTLENELLAFDKRDGKEIGKFKILKKVLNTNPLPEISEIFIGVFDPQTEHSKLFILKKKIAVKLIADKSSPQKIGEEIVFKANAVGLNKPKFEFYIKSEEMNSFVVVQELSFNNVFSWFPEKEGNYIIKVIAKDKENKVENSINFSIKK